MSVEGLKTAFYDAMFECDDTNINPLEEKALANVRALLNDREALSSHLAPLPVIQIQLLELLEKPDVEFAELEALIEQDPALATRVLSIVNSPLYLTRQPSQSLLDAIKRLGISGISGITSSILMEELRPVKPIYFKLFGKLIWEHSLHCAYLCKGFGRQMNVDEFSAHFLGLIHDVGKILIFNCLNAALREGILEGDPGSRIFKETMTEMSRDMSYFIAREWGLPERFWSALAEQVHTPKGDLALALHRANLCAELYLLSSKGKISPQEQDQYLQEMDCEPELWQEFRDKAEHIAIAL